MKNFSNWVILSFVALAIIVSIVSTLHSINFFKLTNTPNMATTLAIAFEIGQLASLAAIVNSDKINPRISWSLFIFLTIFQIMNNIFHSFEYLSANPGSYKNWSDLFGLNKMDDLIKKRMLSIISGGFLPLLSIGFSKALVNYLRSLEKIKKENLEIQKIEDEIEKSVEESTIIEEKPQVIIKESDVEPIIEEKIEIVEEIKESKIEEINEHEPIIIEESIIEENEEPIIVEEEHIEIVEEVPIIEKPEHIIEEIVEEPIVEEIQIKEPELIIVKKDEPLETNFIEFDKNSFSDLDSNVLKIEEPAFITRIRKATFLSPEFSFKLKQELSNNLDFNHPDFKETLKQKLINNSELKDFVVKKLKELDAKTIN